MILWTKTPGNVYEICKITIHKQAQIQKRSSKRHEICQEYFFGLVCFINLETVRVNILFSYADNDKLNLSFTVPLSSGVLQSQLTLDLTDAHF
jgi:hypothetical protein